MPFYVIYNLKSCNPFGGAAMRQEHILRLLHHVAKHDTDAFLELYTEFSPLVFSIALSILKNTHDANDTVQDVFIKIFGVSAENIPTSNPIGWIYSIAKNKALENYKKIKREYHTNIDDIDFISYNQAIEEPAYIISILSCLSPEEAQIVILKVVYRFTHKEISQLLHLPQGTVQWKYKTALNKIKKSMPNEG